MDTIQSNFLDNSHKLKEASREALVSLVDNYHRILPKIMGCGFCQFFHELLASECFKHVRDRQAELRELSAIFSDQDFNPKYALQRLEDMMPFQGAFGTDFYEQCQKLLVVLIRQKING